MNVFVDTSGIVALLWSSDAHHHGGVRAWKQLCSTGARFVTTDLVLAETVTLVRARAGFDLSCRAGDRLLHEPFEMVWVDRPLVETALELYGKYRDHMLSLCDCVSFAVMKRRRLRTAFAFDSDFEAVGFATVRDAQGAWASRPGPRGR